MNNQLIKNTNLGTEKVFPKTHITDVFDKNTGISLSDVLNTFNMYFLSYVGNTFSTRCQIPKNLRREGLWITYVTYKHQVITEWYNSDNIDDNDWGLDTYWRQGSNKLIGDLSISSNGNWVINNVETEFKAQGESGISPVLRIYNNRLQVSYDFQKTWEYLSEQGIISWFRWFNAEGTGNVGKIQTSKDTKNWEDLSPVFKNKLFIQKFVETIEQLPDNADVGDIYMVGPTYSSSDTEHKYPHYRMYIYQVKEWIDTGEFNSEWVDGGEFTNVSIVGTNNILDKAITEEKLSDSLLTRITTLENQLGGLSLVIKTEDEYQILVDTDSVDNNTIYYVTENPKEE